jgi:acyl-CoA dehydrogenase
MTRLSAAFAFAADMGMLTLGGDLKRCEKISGRFADILSHLYLASAAIKHHEDNGRPEEDRPLVEWAVEDSLDIVETRLAEISANFPVRGVGALIRLFALPLGRRIRPPSDRLGGRVARLLMEPGSARERLVAGLFFDPDRNDPVGLLELAMRKVIASDQVERKLRKATGCQVNPWDYESVLTEAVDSGVINDIEAQTVREAMELATDAIAVDTFGEPLETRSLDTMEASVG